jgi:hypothetical protein
LEAPVKVTSLRLRQPVDQPGADRVHARHARQVDGQLSPVDPVKPIRDAVDPRERERPRETQHLPVAFQAFAEIGGFVHRERHWRQNATGARRVPCRRRTSPAA